VDPPPSASADQPVDPSARSSPASILRPAIVYAVVFGAAGAYLPYISIFLSSVGLDLGSIGALIGLYAAVSLVAAPTWGAIADAVGDVRGPVLVAAILSTLSIGLLAIAASPLTVAIAIGSLAASYAGIIPMIDSQAVRLVGRRERFGIARAPGSAAFVVVAFATGAVIAALGPRGMFLVDGLLTLVIGAAAWTLLRISASPIAATSIRRRGGVSALAGRAVAGLSPATIVGILRTPRYGPFFVALVLIWTSLAAMQGFISLRIVALGGDGTLIAATWSLGALLEVFLMPAFPWFARRIGTERLIVIGAVAFAARAIVSAVTDQPAVIVVAALGNGIGFTFVYVGVVTWVAATVERRSQATAQGIFTGTSNGLGTIGGAVVGGAVAGALGLPTLFAIAAGGSLAGGALVWLAIGRVPVRRAAPEPSAADA
jgi:PPP family 3-phenylpropionic acid transporter